MDTSPMSTRSRRKRSNVKNTNIDQETTCQKDSPSAKLRLSRLSTKSGIGNLKENKPMKPLKTEELSLQPAENTKADDADTLMQDGPLVFWGSPGNSHSETVIRFTDASTPPQVKISTKLTTQKAPSWSKGLFRPENSEQFLNNLIDLNDKIEKEKEGKTESEIEELEEGASSKTDHDGGKIEDVKDMKISTHENETDNKDVSNDCNPLIIEISDDLAVSDTQKLSEECQKMFIPDKEAIQAILSESVTELLNDDSDLFSDSLLQSTQQMEEAAWKTLSDETTLKCPDKFRGSGGTVKNDQSLDNMIKKTPSRKSSRVLGRTFVFKSSNQTHHFKNNASLNKLDEDLQSNLKTGCIYEAKISKTEIKDPLSNDKSHAPAFQEFLEDDQDFVLSQVTTPKGKIKKSSNTVKSKPTSLKFDNQYMERREEDSSGLLYDSELDDSTLLNFLDHFESQPDSSSPPQSFSCTPEEIEKKRKQAKLKLEQKRVSII